MVNNKIPTIRFKDSSLDTIMAGLKMEQVKEVVFKKFIPNLKEVILKNKKECIFCYVDEDFQVMVSKEDYSKIIECLEKYYLEKEDYDTCIILRDLKSKL